MRQIPKEHQIYRHFKGDLYQIVTIARHSETKEEMVVYRSIYGDSGNWVRPLSMFLSEVDRDKYPDAPQKYRFTRMDKGQAIEEPKELEKSEELKEPVTENENISGIDPLLEQFLDADNYQEKIDILFLMKKRGNKEMLSYVATSLDLEIDSDDFDEMFRQIHNCMKTMAKYECTRLRS